MPILLRYPWDMSQPLPSDPVLQGTSIGEGLADIVLQGQVIGDDWTGIIEQGAPLPGDGTYPVLMPRVLLDETTVVPMAVDILDSGVWTDAIINPAVGPTDGLLRDVPGPFPLLVKPEPWKNRLLASVLCSQSGDAPFIDVGTEPDATSMYRKPDGVEGGYHIRAMSGVYANLSLVPNCAFAPATSTVRYAVSGTTLDSAGTPLPGCRVIMIDVSRLAVGGAPVIGDEMSSGVDGSFAIAVPSNGDYMIIAYLPGSPDRAGVTLHPLAPTQIG